jgi:hypothetical protein
MEDIITQKFSFATITPLKNYCRLDERETLNHHMRDDLDMLDEVDIFQNTIKTSASKSFEIFYKPSIGRIVSLPEKNKRKVFFFETKEPIQERFQLKYVLSAEFNSFDTTKDSQIKRHYGNAFSEIKITTIERSVRRRDDKVTIKVYIGHKYRKFNCIYFKKNYVVYSITINIKTGNFTTATISKGRKLTNKRFRVNSFNEIKHIMSGILSVNGHIEKSSRLKNEFNEIFNDLTFTTKIQNALSIDLGCISYGKDSNQFFKDLLKLFVKVKKIKVPDGDYEFWLTNLYPTEKFLKKNDRKLIVSVLDLVGLKSKFMVKILHEFPTIDFVGLYTFCQFFGSDFAKYVANINIGVFKNSHRKETKSTGTLITKGFMLTIKNKKYDLNDSEKENLIKIVNSVDYNETQFFSERMVQLFQDHFDMIKKIRDYDSSCSMKAKNMNEFNEEHRELSKIISAIRKGWVIEYIYDDKTISDIESPINAMINLGTEEEPQLSDLNIKLYPFILKREEDYSEEGGFMHHCVATYSDKDRSIIISLRSENQMDRVTCEYDIQTGRCVQERYFCNGQPPTQYILALKYLKGKIEKHARFGTLNWKEKIKVPIKINGVEVQTPPPRRYEDILDGYIPLPF